MPVVEIAYNPNDFYYVSSGLYQETKCQEYLSDKSLESSCCRDKLDKTSCKDWNQNSETCYKYELCLNKENADLVNNIENNNSGADERRANLQNLLNNEILKTINISASIILISYLSVYFFKS